MASESWELGASGVEISGGYEFETFSSTVPKTNDQNAPTTANDSERSGARIALTFKGISANYFIKGNGAHGTLTFIPLYVVLDGSLDGAPTGFGRVSGAAGDINTIRRFVGALVEGTYEPANGMFSFRGKLARADYDRDKGFWDWKALDAEVVLKKAYAVGNSGTVFDLEVSLGAAFGGVYMNGLADIEKALGIAPASNSALTVNPMAAIRTGFHGADWKIELVTSAEQRFDLGLNKASYLGKETSVNSTHVTAVLEGEYIFAKPRSRSKFEAWSLFANAGFEYDNLTLSNVFFKSGDAFQSFRLMGGLRGKF